MQSVHCLDRVLNGQAETLFWHDINSFEEFCSGVAVGRLLCSCFLNHCVSQPLFYI